MLKSNPVSRICVMALGLFMAGVTGCGEGPSEASVAEKIKAAKETAALAALAAASAAFVVAFVAELAALLACVVAFDSAVTAALAFAGSRGRR